MTKLTVKNDWEYLTYFVGDTQLDEKLGGFVDIRWPNGMEEKDIEFRSVKKSTKVYDMGHDYMTTYYDLMFTTKHNGLPIDMQLGHVKVSNVRQ